MRDAMKDVTVGYLRIVNEMLDARHFPSMDPAFLRGVKKLAEKLRLMNRGWYSGRSWFCVPTLRLSVSWRRRKWWTARVRTFREHNGWRTWEASALVWSVLWSHRTN